MTDKVRLRSTHTRQTKKARLIANTQIRNRVQKETKKDSQAWKKRSTGFFEKPTIARRDTVTISSDREVELIEFETAAKLDDSVMILGFPGATLTSILVSGYLRETLELELVAVIASPHFPPRCLIENGCAQNLEHSKCLRGCGSRAPPACRRTRCASLPGVCAQSPFQSAQSLTFAFALQNKNTYILTRSMCDE